MALITDDAKYEVSIILTLFNSKNYYLRSIDSILKQTFKNYELVIVDDGSTDNIENEIFSCLKLYKNFKYIRHSNRGHPLSLNSGIINSTASLITFLDSDDEYKRKHIEERVIYMANNRSVDMIYSPATIIGEEKDFFVPDARDENKLIHLKDCVIGGTFFGKRKVFDELNGFENIYSHDYEFFVRAQNKFEIIKYNSPTYIYYRNNPDSVISKLKKTFSHE